MVITHLIIIKSFSKDESSAQLFVINFLQKIAVIIFQ
jgi:hypothetical protein